MGQKATRSISKLSFLQVVVRIGCSCGSKERSTLYVDALFHYSSTSFSLSSYYLKRMTNLGCSQYYSYQISTSADTQEKFLHVIGSSRRFGRYCLLHQVFCQDYLGGLSLPRSIDPHFYGRVRPSNSFLHLLLIHQRH